MASKTSAPVAVPDTDHPPAACAATAFSHGTVRLIPIDKAQPRLADQASERMNPERDLERARDQLHDAYLCVSAAKAALAEALHEATRSQAAADATRHAYEQARADGRRADLRVRQCHRTADDARLVLRQAHERVARLEGLDGLVIDLTDDAPANV
jgi:hypothetical protein